MLTVSEGRVGERWNKLRMRTSAVTKKSTGTAPDAAFLSTKRKQGEAKETKTEGDNGILSAKHYDSMYRQN